MSVGDYPGKNDIEKIRFSGFVAQDVEKAAREVGYDFGGITKPKTSTDLYSLSYESFVVPLVKAVQEQQQVTETQRNDIDLLKAQVAELTKSVSTLQHR
jgi:hypothetical protein